METQVIMLSVISQGQKEKCYSGVLHVYSERSYLDSGGCLRLGRMGIGEGKKGCLMDAKLYLNRSKKCWCSIAH